MEKILPKLLQGSTMSVSFIYTFSVDQRALAFRTSRGVRNACNCLKLKKGFYIGKFMYNDKSLLPGGKLAFNSPTMPHLPPLSAHICGSGAL